MEQISYTERPSFTRNNTQRDSVSTGFQNIDMDIHNTLHSKIGLEQRVSSQEIIQSLSGDTLKPTEFTHSNMLPFFKGSVKQNIDPESNREILEHHTGVVLDKAPKKEQQVFFQPQKNTSFVHGAPSHQTLELDRLSASRIKNNELPFEKVRVGPGLGKTYAWKPSGGFQQSMAEDAIKPKTVDELRGKSNPKISYEGRTICGKSLNDKPTQQVHVEKRRPDTFFKHSPARYNTTAAGHEKAACRSTPIVRNTNRKKSTAVVGPAGPAAKTRAPLRSQVQASQKPEFKSTGPRNLHKPRTCTDPDQNDHGRKSLRNTETRRVHTQGPTPLSNATSTVKALFAPLLDAVRFTRKELYVDNNYIGSKGNVQPDHLDHITQDKARPTLKETGIHDTHEGFLASGVYQTVVYDPDDVAKTTQKETLVDNTHSGHVSSHQHCVQVYDPQEVARKTLKETNIHNSREGFLSSASQRGPALNPDDAARTTHRELHENHTHVGQIRRADQRGPVYDPKDTPQTTIKETQIHHTHSGQIHSSKAGHHDPTQAARKTMKETNIHHTHEGHLDIAKRGFVYDPDDIARTTLKETHIENCHDGFMGGQGALDATSGPILNPEDTTRPTHRQTLDEEATALNLQGPRAEAAHIKNDTARTTIKETTLVTDPHLQVEAGRDDGYKTKTIELDPTQKELLSDRDYIGQAAGNTLQGEGGGYMSQKTEAPTTKRQLTSDLEYSGIAGGGSTETQKGVSYESIYNLTLNELKQDLVVERIPTASGSKKTVGAEGVQMKSSRLVEDDINCREQIQDSLHANIPEVGQLGESTSLKTSGPPAENDRNHPELLDAFKHNPYTKSLNSF